MHAYPAPNLRNFKLSAAWISLAHSYRGHRHSHPSLLFPSKLYTYQAFTYAPAEIACSCPLPNRDVERQSLHIPDMAQVTLSNLRHLLFRV
jgi:hypothetical protein